MRTNMITDPKPNWSNGWMKFWRKLGSSLIKLINSLSASSPMNKMAKPMRNSPKDLIFE